ncbi:MAG: hypothetical protein WCD76_11840, partial [Pyrinomonadaceae bacterium]
MRTLVPAKYLLGVALALTFPGWSQPARAQEARPCSFSGPPLEQAKCLLRPVAKSGIVGAARPTLPDPLERLIGQRTTITKTSLKAFLTAHGINESEIGGALSGPVSQTNAHVPARYFIIHDTSDPVPVGATFPPTGMDTPAWSGNNLGRFLPPRKANPVAHVFINRLGQSATGHDFSVPFRSTQFELRSVSRRGLFLGVESIQPRHLDAHGSDAVSPDPGFTDAQLDRLALVYVAASVRRGEWLIPGFHAVID